MVRQFNTSDEGKTVVTAGGEEVGKIEMIENGMAHVSPKGSLSRSIRRRLGWGEDDEDTFEVRHSQVRRITNDKVELEE